MALASFRPCTFPGCNAIVRGASRCEKHPYERAARQSDPFYSSGRWRGLRAVFLKKHPLCSDCGAPAEHVDHVIARKDAPFLDLQWSNLRALCRPCHTRKTNIHDGAGWRTK